jgi:uncharacterized protein (DUF2141 family)
MLKIYTLFISLFLLSFSSSKTGNITITITGIDIRQKGLLRIGVFKKEGYPNADKVSDGKIIPVTGCSMTVNFPSINPGTYAIVIVQDKDKSGHLTKNMLGLPTEPYGFSKNIYGLLGAPDFNDISFKISEGESIHSDIQIK